MVNARGALVAAAREILGLLNRVIPKQDKVVLSGYPDGEDSIQEIARRMSDQPDLKTFVLVDRVAAEMPQEHRAIVHCRKKSLLGLWHYLTARYVFFTHGLYLSPRPPASQICVNVWHGMPLKRIGHMIGRVPPHATRVIATSPFFGRYVAKAFGKAEDEILVTGIPRNDVMVRAARRSVEIKRAMSLGKGDELPRLIFWLPTFRQGVRGIIRTDGLSHDSIFGMDDMDITVFAELLEKHDCVCVAKPHPMAAKYNDRIDSPRIRIWSDADLAKHGLSLYEVVGAADLLITDASSVYVDYLLLNRPVVIAFPDLEAYKATRGFSLDPVEKYLAGPIAHSFEQLCHAIEQCLVSDAYQARREELTALFHAERDDQATARLMEAVLPAKSLQAEDSGRKTWRGLTGGRK